MTLRQNILKQLEKMYDKLDVFQETTMFQTNPILMHECGEVMGALNNLIDTLELAEVKSNDNS